MSNLIDLATFPLDQLHAAVAKAGGQRKFSQKHGCKRTTLQNYLKKAATAKFRSRPVKEVYEEKVTSGVRRFILTSAQDSTLIHEPFLLNLEAYAQWFTDRGDPCDIMVAGFTYNKSLFEDHTKRTPLWPERIHQYMQWERVRLGDKVDFCAEMNTRPTAPDPLSGFETYTQQRWGVFPHAKVQLKSVPTMRDEPAKIIMTTGTISMPNYVPLRAGIKAQFHHIIGAVLVEVDADGTFFCRHLLGEEDGSFYDLDRHVTSGEITEENRVLAMNWGDLHVAQIDPVACGTSFGIAPTEGRDPKTGERLWVSYPGRSVLDTLRPHEQYFHDVSDFQARNHHNIRDPHLQYELYQSDRDSVENEMNEVGWFINATSRSWCTTLIVDSNHDCALVRWLKEADYKTDPANALFFLKCQTAIYQAIHDRDRDFSIFEQVVRWNFKLPGVKFLKTDESHLIGSSSGFPGGPEGGLHGHNGANGGKGSGKAFAKMGRKSNTGHTHSAAILDGNCTSGTKSKLFMGYNNGLSSWSHSDIATYLNQKRAILTMCNGKWYL